MKTRTIPVFMATAAVVAAVGVGVYIHGAGDHQETAPASAARHHSKPEAKDHRLTSARTPSVLRLLPTSRNLKLKWAPMGELAPAKETHSESPSVKITRANVPRPLNLELPADTPRDTDSLGGRPASAPAETNAYAQSKIIDPLVLNLQPNFGNRDPGLEDDSHLFSRRSYMRGFMAKNWVTDNVGLQGGLAIKENHLREENSDLRDNVAVGMGVLLSF